MNQLSLKQLLFLGITCLPPAVFAPTTNANVQVSSIEEISADIAVKTNAHDKIYQEIKEITAELAHAEIQISKLEVEEQRMKLAERKLDMEYPDKDTETAKKAYKNSLFQTRKVQFELNKYRDSVPSLIERQTALKKRTFRLNRVIKNLHDDLAAAKQNKNTVAPAAAITTTSKPVAVAAKSTSIAPTKNAQLNALEEKVALQLLKQQEKEKLAKQEEELRKQQALAKKQSLKGLEYILYVEKEALITASATLPPAEAALNIARARALDPLRTAPNFGFKPSLAITNTGQETPQKVGILKHIGNHQYILTFKASQGEKQLSIADKFIFKKTISKELDGKECLLLVDARDKDKPSFQLVAKDG